MYLPRRPPISWFSLFRPPTAPHFLRSSADRNSASLRVCFEQNQCGFSRSGAFFQEGSHMAKETAEGIAYLRALKQPVGSPTATAPARETEDGPGVEFPMTPARLRTEKRRSAR